MPLLSELAQVENPQKVLIYGGPGSGKSALAASLVEEGYDLVWFNTENGLQTLITHVPPELMHKIRVINIEDTRENPNAIETCTKVLSGKPFKICNEHGKIACVTCTKEGKPFEELELSKLDTNSVVVFDSVSQISDSAKFISTRDLGKMDKLEYKHYEKIGIHLSIFFSGVQQAKFHVVCIAHEDDAVDIDKKSKRIPTIGTRAYALKVGKYFDHKVYTAVVNKKHVAASSAMFNPSVPASSRSDLAMETGNVTLGDLLKAKPKAGGSSADVQESEDEDGNIVSVPKQNPLQAKLGRLRSNGSKS